MTELSEQQTNTDLGAGRAAKHALRIDSIRELQSLREVEMGSLPVVSALPAIEKESAMEQHRHTMHQLFSQLGQPSDAASIAQFISTHRPLAGEVRLSDAEFWTPTQAAFLRESIQDDSDWAEVVDKLNSELHAAT